jgi:hypothetical protein
MKNEMGQCNMRDDFRDMIFVLRDMRNDDIVNYLLLSVLVIPSILDLLFYVLAFAFAFAFACVYTFFWTFLARNLVLYL